MHMNKAIALAILAYTSSAAGLSWSEDGENLLARDFDDELFELDARDFNNQQFDARDLDDSDWDIYARNTWDDEYEPGLSVRDGTGGATEPANAQQTGTGARPGNGQAAVETGPATHPQAPQAHAPNAQVPNVQPANAQPIRNQASASALSGAQQRIANRVKHNVVTYQPEELAADLHSQALSQARLQRQADLRAQRQAEAQAKADALAAKRAKHQPLRSHMVTRIQRNPHHVIGSQTAPGNGASAAIGNPASQQGVGTAADNSAPPPARRVHFNFRRSFPPELYY